MEMKSVYKYNDEENKIEEREKGPYINSFYAGFWLRLVAFLIDLFVIGSLKRILLLPITIYSGTSSNFIFIGNILVYLGYFLLMTKLNKGQTIGKMILGLRTVSSDGYDLNWTQAITREFFGRYILKVIPIIYIMVPVMEDKTHIGDFFADTCVVKVKN
ncbi:MAG: RDD family protein [Peptoniphilaceae bacterium]